MSGQQNEPNTSVPAASGQHAPFSPEVEATFQQPLPEERASWEHEREVPEYNRPHHETQHSHESEDRDQSLSSPQHEVHSTSTVLVTRKHKSAAPSQVPAIPVDPAVTALQQQLNDLKRMMASIIPTSSTSAATMTNMPFSDRLDSIALPAGFKLP
ncbi:hypothetical protein LIER_09851 [Lithospermum erythrorhizon]|uniref:Uncharacterized protein n=1 Tax=Lithospermum erythrorhizon TaxID=34254 RepID=A0AAV3PHA0_LITER